MDLEMHERTRPRIGPRRCLIIIAVTISTTLLVLSAVAIGNSCSQSTAIELEQESSLSQHTAQYPAVVLDLKSRMEGLLEKVSRRHDLSPNTSAGKRGLLRHQIRGSPTASPTGNGWFRSFLGLDSSTSPSATPRGASTARGIGGLLGGIGTLFNTTEGGLGGLLSSAGGDIGNALSGLGTSLVADLNGPALALGLGVGAGAVTSLNLSTTDNAKQVVSRLQLTYNVSGGLDDVAMNLGTGASSAVVSVLNTSTVSSAVGSINASSLQPYAMAIGLGIGNGTASGLQLSAQAAAIVPSDATNFPDIAGTFSFAMIKSLFSNVDFNSLSNKLKGAGASFQQITPYLSQAGMGFGTGLGMGLQVLLKLQPSDVLAKQRAVTMIGNSTEADVNGVAESFAMGLITGMLNNVTVSDLVSKATAGLSGTKINLDPIAQGFARGLVQGAGDTISQYGGIWSLVNGTARSVITIPNTTIAFDDTIGGGATGFGQGLGGQGVILAKEIFSHTNAPASGVVSINNTGTSNATVKRNTDLTARQDTAPSSGTSGSSPALNISQFLNTAQLSALTQVGIDALTCRGVGGIFDIAFGLLESKSISTSMLSSINMSSLLKDTLPNGTIRITSGGNIYEVEASAIDQGSFTAIINGVKVNGLKVISFAAVLIIHILIAILIVTSLFPLVLLLEDAQDMLVHNNKPPLPNRANKVILISWRFIFGPVIIVIFTFGILATGSSRHFRTAHGVLGLITTIVFIFSFLLHFRMIASSLGLAGAPSITRNSALLLSLPTVITGFADVSGVSLCATSVIDASLWILVGAFSAGIWILAVAVATLNMWLKRPWQKAQNLEHKPPEA